MAYYSLKSILIELLQQKTTVIFSLEPNSLHWDDILSSKVELKNPLLNILTSPLGTSLF